MTAVNGAVILLIGALLVALLYGLRATPRARRNPPPVVLNKARACDTTGCAYPGWIIAHRRNGDTAHVCGGCYADGTLRGWWTHDDSTDRTGAAT